MTVIVLVSLPGGPLSLRVGFLPDEHEHGFFLDTFTSLSG
jgi:hypothetical protein